MAPPPWLRDGDLHDRRHLPAPGLHRRRRPHHQRLHAVDDRRVGHPAHRAPARAADRQRRAVPRHPAVGEPAGGREVGRPALPGHRGRRHPAPHLARRRCAGAGHRRRCGRPPRAGLDPHADLAGARHRAAGRRAGPPVAERSSTRWSTRSSGDGSVGPDARPFHSGQLAVHGPGDALAIAGRRRSRSHGTRRWTC